MFTAIIIIVAAVIILMVIAAIFPDLPDFIVRHFPDFVTGVHDGFTDYVLPAMFWYAIGLLGWFVISLLLLAIGIIFNSGSIIGLSMLSSIILVYLFFLFPGLVRKVIGRPFLISALRILVAWQAALGFVGLIYPEAITLNLLIGLSLLAFLSVGLASKYNMLDKIVVPAITILCIIVVWKFVAPDNFNAVFGYSQSKSNQFNSSFHNASAENNADAGAAYGRLLKDVSAVYTATITDGKISSISDTLVSLKKDSMFVVIDPKKGPYPYDGQTFIQIKLPDSEGLFAKGQKFWVEADLIEIGDRKEIDASLAPISSKKSVEPIQKTTAQVAPEPTTLFPGTYQYNLKAGQSTPWLQFPQGCANYQISSANYEYKIIFSDGTSYPGGPNTAIPRKNNVELKIIATGDGTVDVSIG